MIHKINWTYLSKHKLDKCFLQYINKISNLSQIKSYVRNCIFFEAHDKKHKMIGNVLTGWEKFLVFGYSCSTMFGLPANLFILYLFARYKDLQTFPNYLLISLCIGDTITSAILSPLTIGQIFSKTPNNSIHLATKYLAGFVAISGYT